MRDSSNATIPSPPDIDTSTLFLPSLWLPNLKAWNELLIYNSFDTATVSRILRVPLVPAVYHDLPIWAPTVSGNYSVKTAYQLCSKKFLHEDDLVANGDWNLIWKLQVPKRIKLLLWRACRNCLPTRYQLQKKGISCPITCILCDEDLENTLHLFITCPWSILCWEEVGLWSHINAKIMDCESFSNLCFQLLSTLDSQQCITFVMNIWSIWRRRNNKYWEGKDVSTSDVVYRASNFYNEWIRYKIFPLNVPHHAAPAFSPWSPPHADYFKANIDASFSSQMNRTGIGVCIRNGAGSFIHARTSWTIPCLAVRDGEAIALLTALQWVSSIGMDCVIFEMDNKSEVDAINNPPSLDLSEFGSIISECSKFLVSFPLFRIEFVRRQINGIAHVLARMTSYNPCLHDYDHVLSCIADLILNEMTRVYFDKKRMN